MSSCAESSHFRLESLSFFCKNIVSLEQMLKIWKRLLYLLFLRAYFSIFEKWQAFLRLGLRFHLWHSRL